MNNMEILETSRPSDNQQLQGAITGVSETGECGLNRSTHPMTSGCRCDDLGQR